MSTGTREKGSAMRSYTRKQVNVIYRAWKEEHIEGSKELFNFLYDLADVPAEDITNGDELVANVKLIVDAIFDGNYDCAQFGIARLAA